MSSTYRFAFFAGLCTLVVVAFDLWFSNSVSGRCRILHCWFHSPDSVSSSGENHISARSRPSLLFRSGSGRQSYQRITRTHFSRYQKEGLERYFRMSPYLSPEARERIANELGTSALKVQVSLAVATETGRAWCHCVPFRTPSLNHIWWRNLQLESGWWWSNDNGDKDNNKGYGSDNNKTGYRQWTRAHLSASECLSKTCLHVVYTFYGKHWHQKLQSIIMSSRLDYSSERCAVLHAVARSQVNSSDDN